MLKGKRIGLLTALASRSNGGVFEAVVTQAEMIRSLGGEVRIFGLADSHSAEDAKRLAPSPVAACRILGPTAVGYAPDLVDALLEADLDLLHLHGIWMYPSRAGAIWAERTGRPYLISPHGMLSTWITGRSRWKKAVARLAYERASWRRASFFHCLTAREADDVAREAGRADSQLIPNSGPPPLQSVKSAGGPHFVFIGRIHTQKNLVPLVEAWSNVAPKGDARLTIAGWGDDAATAALQAALAHAPPSVEFVGPIFGEAKQRLLESAHFTILPSLCEGLPMSVLEGWAMGAPAIMSAECNLPEGYCAGAAIDCGVSAEQISAALEQALGLGHAEWQAMSSAALALASGPFSANEVTARWAAVYSNAMLPVGL